MLRALPGWCAVRVCNYLEMPLEKERPVSQWDNPTVEAMPVRVQVDGAALH
jgi:hypothetical protein